jgi:hypothetical protein
LLADKDLALSPSVVPYPDKFEVRSYVVHLTPKADVARG